MLRVVVDTNVYVSALIFAGAPDEVLALARAGEIELFVSPDAPFDFHSPVLPARDTGEGNSAWAAEVAGGIDVKKTGDPRTDRL